MYEGLKLKHEDLACYDSPLVGFDGKVVIPRGQIRLPMQAGSKVVEVDFIVVDTYSAYTAIVARPLAVCPRGRLLYPSIEGEVSIRGPG